MLAGDSRVSLFLLIGFWNSESYWESSENYEETVPGSGAVMEDVQSRGGPYWGNGTRGMRHGGHSMGLPPPPQYYPGGPIPLGMPNPAMRKPESSDDRHIVARHNEIYPSVRRTDGTCFVNSIPNYLRLLFLFLR